MTTIDVWNRDFTKRLDTLEVDEVERVPINFPVKHHRFCIGRRVDFDRHRHPALFEHLRRMDLFDDARFIIHGDEAFAFLCESAELSLSGSQCTATLVPLIDHMRAWTLPPGDVGRSML